MSVRVSSSFWHALVESFSFSELEKLQSSYLKNEDRSPYLKGSSTFPVRAHVNCREFGVNNPEVVTAACVGDSF